MLRSGDPELAIDKYNEAQNLDPAIEGTSASIARARQLILDNERRTLALKAAFEQKQADESRRVAAEEEHRRQEEERRERERLAPALGAAKRYGQACADYLEYLSNEHLLTGKHQEPFASDLRSSIWEAMFLAGSDLPKACDGVENESVIALLKTARRVEDEDRANSSAQRIRARLELGLLTNEVTLEEAKAALDLSAEVSSRLWADLGNAIKGCEELTGRKFVTNVKERFAREAARAHRRPVNLLRLDDGLFYGDLSIDDDFNFRVKVVNRTGRDIDTVAIEVRVKYTDGDLYGDGSDIIFHVREGETRQVECRIPADARLKRPAKGEWRYEISSSTLEYRRPHEEWDD